jgi:glycosyltransferase involved in cell wall biosynthesis
MRSHQSAFPRIASQTHLGEPVFGFIIVGGAVNGAAVRDIRLANELADRDYRVHVWWAMDRPQAQVLRPSIEQHWLFHGFRYIGRYFGGLKDAVGRWMSIRYSDQKRDHVVQKRPQILKAMWHGQVRQVCEGVEHDERLVRRFVRQLAAGRVTHLLPALEILCPWAAAAKQLMPHRLRYAVTFQGYEVYGNYARELGCEQKFYARIAEAVDGSDWPAIAVSSDYADRIVQDIGLSAESLVAIPPGVPTPLPMDRRRAEEMVTKHFPSYRADLPLVTFVGRRDTEKGIDLLLYAANILRRGGVQLQVFVCGPTAFGNQYSKICFQIAEELRSDIQWQNWINDELRTALFMASRCVVYPSIHREPFGMVPVEAMAQGTPAIVPDWGGVAGAIRANGEQGGLLFNAWDSGHLAHQIARLLSDDELHGRLSQAGSRVADHYSVAKMADRVLNHIGFASTSQSSHRAPHRAA